MALKPLTLHYEKFVDLLGAYLRLPQAPGWIQVRFGDPLSPRRIGIAIDESYWRMGDTPEVTFAVGNDGFVYDVTLQSRKLSSEESRCGPVIVEWQARSLWLGEPGVDMLSLLLSPLPLERDIRHRSCSGQLVVLGVAGDKWPTSIRVSEASR